MKSFFCIVTLFLVIFLGNCFYFSFMTGMRAGRFLRLLSHILLSLFLSPAILLPFEQLSWASKTVYTITKTGSVISTTHHTSPIKPASMMASSQLAKTWQAYQLPAKTISVSPLTRLPVLADGQSALPSNANNFHGAWSAHVDPRTGNAAFTLTMASTLYNLGQSKRELTLSYTGSPSAKGPDSFDLGPHWSWNVGTEHPSTSEVAGHKTTDITTGDGHSFTMESDRNALGQTVWHPLRHKLGDVIITGRPGDWTISMATGIREHLKNGYEDWEESRDGQRIWFYYDRNGVGDITRHLVYICAHTLTPSAVQGSSNHCKNNGIWLTYRYRNVIVHGLQTLIAHRAEDGGIANISSVTMPPLSSAGISSLDQVASINFSYDDQGHHPWLMHSITYPTGGTTIFLYNEESDRPDSQIRGLPVGLNRAHLPVVTEQISSQTETGLKKKLPAIHVWYRYGSGDTDQHNYTGYQEKGNMEPGKDNLMDQTDSYTYSVTKDNGLTSTTTTYNKYHLPLGIVQRDDQQQSLLAASRQNYLPWKNTTFTRLPPNYSLATGAIKTLYALDTTGQDRAISPAKVIQAKRYNNNGQTIWQRDAYGRETFTQYCPPAGDSHCPAADPLWPEVTLPEKVLMVPARHSPGGSVPFLVMTTVEDPAPAVEVQFDYTRLPIARHYRQMILASTKASDTSGFWQVKSKTVGTLPLTQVIGLEPGSALPDLTAGEISTWTGYQYNRQQSSPVYGQLIRLSVVKHPRHTPVLQGQSFTLAASAVPARPQQKFTLNVTHNVDPRTGTRTTVMAVAPVSSSLSSNTVLASGGDLSLGTKVYSLTRGVKLVAEDTLKTEQTRWSYDLWNRPIKETVTPLSGGQPQTITWIYIMTPQEQAVVKTMPDGFQQKVILSADEQVLSTWHRFKNQADKPVKGTVYWIPDSAITYTQTGKPASKTIYHAADAEGTQPGKTIALTTTYGYDTLNRKVWEQTADGQVKVTVRDDPEMRVVNYVVAVSPGESLGPSLKVIESNLLGKRWHSIFCRWILR